MTNDLLDLYYKGSAMGGVGQASRICPLFITYAFSHDDHSISEMGVGDSIWFQKYNYWVSLFLNFIFECLKNT